MAPTQRHRWLTLPDSRSSRRSERLVHYVLDQARADFAERYPNARFGPVVGVIAAYEEESNIGAVLKVMPTLVDDHEVSTLVVVDGGSDRTAQVALDAGVFTCVLPVNLGQGAALRLGYALAAEHGARYIVTLDADGQNDPTEMATMLEPLLDDSADFVIVVPPARNRPDHRPVPAGRCQVLRLGHQHDRQATADRLVKRISGLPGRRVE